MAMNKTEQLELTRLQHENARLDRRLSAVQKERDLFHRIIEILAKDLDDDELDVIRREARIE